MSKIEALIVEDDAAFGTLLKDRLERSSGGLSVRLAGSAEECLRLVREKGVDCILSDYKMPGMTGLELLKNLRSAGNETPFILITGEGAENIVREAFKNGAFDYFDKENITARVPRIINTIEQAVNKAQTERMFRAAELALIEEKNKLDAVLASIGDAISIQDTDFRVLYQNPAHRRMVGAHVGEHCYRAYVGKDDVCQDCHLARSFADGGVHTSVRVREVGGVTEYLEIKGSPVVDALGNLIAGIESIRDITERKEAEQERERLLKGVSATGEGIALNDRDDRFVYVNAAHAAIYGYTPAELRGRSWKDVTPPELIPEAKKFVEKTLHDRGVGEFYAEFPGLRKDGTQVPTEVTATAIWDAEGKYNGHVCIVRDVTEKKRLERERSDFFAMVTHDLKSPMGVITGYADLLASSEVFVKDDEIRGMLGGIKRSAGKVVNLIEDFLTVSRMETGNLAVNPVAQDVKALLLEVHAEVKSEAAGRGHSLGFDVEEGLPLVFMDRRLVHRAVANLLENAVRYTPKGGEIVLKAGLKQDHGMERVFISVRDNGPGIPAEEQERVFDMYYRSPRTAGTKGTGLGLTIVRAVAAAHGGSVELESGPDMGSAFSLVLPVLPASTGGQRP